MRASVLYRDRFSRAVLILVSLCAISVVLVLATSGLAYGPTTIRLCELLGSRNLAAGRAVPLSFAVVLKLGESQEIIAKGRLDSDPSGLSRLELVGMEGDERHLNLLGRVFVSRNRTAIQKARPFLPPLFLMQGDSAEKLAALLYLPVDFPTDVSFSHLGDKDCFVLASSREDGLVLLVDVDSLNLVGIRLDDGTLFEMGPLKQFGRVRVPGWVRITREDGFHATLLFTDLLGGSVSVNQYNSQWLYEASKRKTF